MDENNQNIPMLLSEKQAAAILGCSKQTLGTLRRSGDGPRHIRIANMVKYSQLELIQWLKERTTK